MKSLIFQIIFALTSECTLFNETSLVPKCFNETHDVILEMGHSIKFIRKRSSDHVRQRSYHLPSSSNNKGGLKHIIKKSFSKVQKFNFFDSFLNWFRKKPRKKVVRTPLVRIRPTRPNGWVRWRDLKYAVPNYTCTYGKDLNNKTLYVGRAICPDGSIIAGYIVEGNRCLFIESSGFGRCALDIQLLLGQFPYYSTSGWKNHPDALAAGMEHGRKFGACFLTVNYELYVGKVCYHYGKCFYSTQDAVSQASASYNEIMGLYVRPVHSWVTRPPHKYNPRTMPASFEDVKKLPKVVDDWD